MFDKRFGEVNIAENKRHSLQETDVIDGGFVPNSIGHYSSQCSHPGIPICSVERRLLWKRF